MLALSSMDYSRKMRTSTGLLSAPSQLPDQILALSGTRINNNNDNDNDNESGNDNSGNDNDNDNDNRNGNKKARKNQSQQQHHSRLTQPLKSFPWKLYTLLERCEYENNKVLLSNEQQPTIVEWLPSGKAFVIYNEGRFAKEILSNFCFGNSTTTSNTTRQNKEGDDNTDDNSACATPLEIFQTNLHLWGFKTSRVIVSTGYNIRNNGGSESGNSDSDSNSILNLTKINNANAHKNSITFITNEAENIENNSNKNCGDGDGGGVSDDVCCVCSHPLFARGFLSKCEGMKIIEQHHSRNNSRNKLKSKNKPENETKRQTTQSLF